MVRNHFVYKINIPSISTLYDVNQSSMFKASWQAHWQSLWQALWQAGTMMTVVVLCQHMYCRLGNLLQWALTGTLPLRCVCLQWALTGMRSDVELPFWLWVSYTSSSSSSSSKYESAALSPHLRLGGGNPPHVSSHHTLLHVSGLLIGMHSAGQAG